jgi:ribosome-binding protein aMBF1 (putative translation factor)
MKHSALKKVALKKPGVKAEYEALAPEFNLLRQILRARSKAGLSQADVAERMGTHAPAITRLESALGTGKHSPSNQVHSCARPTNWPKTTCRKTSGVIDD